MNPLIAALDEVTEQAKASGKPLAERLNMIADYVREHAPPFASAVEEFVGRLLTAEAGGAVPQIHDTLPNFILPDQNSKLVTLERLLAEGPVVVAFLRGHWCPYCRITAAALSEIADEVAALGGRIVAITPEKRQYTRAINDQTGGAYSVLSDIDNGYALSLNLAVWVSEAMADIIASAGNDIPTYQGNESWIIPIPAMFVLNQQGVIVARHVNADYRQRADTAGIVAAVRALQSGGSKLGAAQKSEKG